MGFLGFKSKEEKELENRLKIKQGVNSLKKYERTLDKKKNELLALAQEARQKGISQQEAVARSGLKMLMGYQKRCGAMILQIQIAESMRDLTMLSSDFVGIMGKVGKELIGVNQTVNFAKNQLAFEKGVMAAEAALDQLENFMESAGFAFEDAASEQDLDNEIEQLIDATGAAKGTAVDDEIQKRRELLKQKQNLVQE